MKLGRLFRLERHLRFDILRLRSGIGAVRAGLYGCCLMMLALLAGSPATANSQNAPGWGTPGAQTAQQKDVSRIDAPATKREAERARQWSHLTRAQMRAKIRAGEVNLCVTHTLLKSPTSPVIVFHNSCDYAVNVLLCAHVQGQPRGYYLILMQSESDTRHRLSIPAGKKYKFLYNSCEHANCTPPEAAC